MSSGALALCWDLGADAGVFILLETLLSGNLMLTHFKPKCYSAFWVGKADWINSQHARNEE